ncbi:hypothetical protein LJC07_04505 [Christensenellaceae bacterium OttesenSCG-928-L17]|nr:hypothetical protein [Christensenellaceae bacterium OttesenSCG-928-L17]
MQLLKGGLSNAFSKENGELILSIQVDDAFNCGVYLEIRKYEFNLLRIHYSTKGAHELGKRIIAEFSGKGISYDEAVKMFDFTPYTDVPAYDKTEVAVWNDASKTYIANFADVPAGLSYTATELLTHKGVSINMPNHERETTGSPAGGTPSTSVGNDEELYFRVSVEGTGVVAEFTNIYRRETVTLTVNKTVAAGQNDDAFVSPASFDFLVIGTGGYTETAKVTMNGLTGTATIDVPKGLTYTVKEVAQNNMADYNCTTQYQWAMAEKQSGMTSSAKALPASTSIDFTNTYTRKMGELNLYAASALGENGVGDLNDLPTKFKVKITAGNKTPTFDPKAYGLEVDDDGYFEILAAGKENLKIATGQYEITQKAATVPGYVYTATHGKFGAQRLNFTMATTSSPKKDTVTIQLGAQSPLGVSFLNVYERNGNFVTLNKAVAAANDDYWTGIVFPNGENEAARAFEVEIYKADGVNTVAVDSVDVFEFNNAGVLVYKETVTKAPDANTVVVPVSAIESTYIWLDAGRYILQEINATASGFNNTIAWAEGAEEPAAGNNVEFEVNMKGEYTFSCVNSYTVRPTERERRIPLGAPEEEIPLGPPLTGMAKNLIGAILLLVLGMMAAVVVVYYRRKYLQKQT